jgi:hypothetical protein
MALPPEARRLPHAREAAESPPTPIAHWWQDCLSWFRDSDAVHSLIIGGVIAGLMVLAYRAGQRSARRPG